MLPRALLLAALMALPFVLAALFAAPHTPQASERARLGFVGSETCASCHTPQAAAWRESDHARAMAAATPANVLGDFSGVTVTDGRHTATFRREGERHLIRTDGPGGVIAVRGGEKVGHWSGGMMLSRAA
jgi:hypothetical protein